MTEPKAVHFNRNVPEYNLESYVGRLQNFFASHTNPMLMFVSNEKLKWAYGKLEWYKKQVEEQNLPNGNVLISPEETANVRNADKIINATIHPDTGKKVPWYFRMSSFLPANLPTIVCMLIFQRNYYQVIFFQWLNQTYNAGWNFFNRQASAPITNTELLIAYTGAVGSSMGVGLTARYLSNKALKNISSPIMNILCNTVVASLSMAVAGSCNIMLIRQNEKKYGIDIKSEDGTVLGKSKLAANKAVLTSAATRFALPLTNIAFIVPYFWMLGKISKLGIPPMGGNKRFVLHKLAIVVVQMTLGLPLALALFPKTLKVPIEKLEPEFKGRETEGGKYINTIYFNKGL